MKTETNQTYTPAEKQAAIAKAGSRKRRLLTVPFLSIQDEKSVIVKVVGNFQIKHSKTWESDFITMEVMLENNTKAAIVLDGGLRGALKLTGIIAGDVVAEEKTIISQNLTVLKPDMLIEIEFAGKIEVANGKANQYNVYELEN